MFDPNKKWNGLIDVMLDIETTGVMPDRHAIIQIAAVKFNAQTGDVDENFFDQALMIPPTRHWQESTREFWAKMPDIYTSIHNRMVDPVVVLRQFVDWLGNDKFRLWAKPSHFEHQFLASYFNDYEIGNPFHFRDTMDVNSFIRGKFFPEPPPNFEKDIVFEGPAHNALFDTFHQIKFLLAAINHESKSETE